MTPGEKKIRVKIERSNEPLKVVDIEKMMSRTFDEKIRIKVSPNYCIIYTLF